MTEVMIFKFLRCWNKDCGKTYPYKEEIDTEKKLIVTCPYCDTKAVVDFAPYRREKKIVLRNSEKEVLSVEYNIPKIMPTSKF